MVQKTTARCIMQTGACLSLCLRVFVCFCLCVLHIMRVDGKWCKSRFMIFISGGVFVGGLLLKTVTLLLLIRGRRW